MKDQENFENVDVRLKEVEKELSQVKLARLLYRVWLTGYSKGWSKDGEAPTTETFIQSLQQDLEQSKLLDIVWGKELNATISHFQNQIGNAEE